MKTEHIIRTKCTDNLLQLLLRSILLQVIYCVPYVGIYDPYIPTSGMVYDNNECTKVQNPRRTRVRESLKAHALDQLPF